MHSSLLPANTDLLRRNFPCNQVLLSLFTKGAARNAVCIITCYATFIWNMQQFIIHVVTILYMDLPCRWGGYCVTMYHQQTHCEVRFMILSAVSSSEVLYFPLVIPLRFLYKCNLVQIFQSVYFLSCFIFPMKLFQPCTMDVN